jgi:ankyrin repeat protein
MLISTGSVARESGQQESLIDLLCDYGADPNTAIRGTVLHGELGAANALLRRGAHIDLPVAAGLGRIEDVRHLLAGSNLAGSNRAGSNNDSKSTSDSELSTEDRHLALALASQYGHVEIVRVLLDAGEDPNRYNPVGGHSHSTPLHQAAAGHQDVVRLLVERGARLDLKDILWHATPADWAKHEGKTEIEAYLRSKMESEKAK